MGGGVKVLNLSTLQKKIKTKHDKKTTTGHGFGTSGCYRFSGNLQQTAALYCSAETFTLELLKVQGSAETYRFVAALLLCKSDVFEHKVQIKAKKRGKNIKKQNVSQLEIQGLQKWHQFFFLSFSFLQFMSGPRLHIMEALILENVEFQFKCNTLGSTHPLAPAVQTPPFGKFPDMQTPNS